MPPEEAQVFRTTVWQRIREAKAGRESAVNEVLVRYRPAILGFLARRGVDAEEAEDVAQEVLLALVDDRVLARADPALGRFRNLLIAVMKNILRERERSRGRLKRGGELRVLSLDRATESSAGPLGELVAAPEEDDEFDREWAKNLVRLAMQRLEAEYEPYFAAIDLHLREDLSYRDVAARLGKSEAAVRNYLHEGRLKLAEYLRAEIAGYSSSADEYEDEKRHLRRHLAVPDPS